MPLTSEPVILKSCLLSFAWFIWKWKSRNAEVFNDVEWTDWFIINQISTLMNYILCKILKLTTDGSSLRNPAKSAGFGGQIRDTEDKWVGFAGSCGVTTSLNASTQKELLAIHHSLQVAWNTGLT
ncbi:hypothetical protein CR513_09486, partial [Mucuna pruriens]